MMNLNVLSFDNDMRNAHFGTKFCIYIIENAVNIYRRNIVYLKKI